MASEQREKLFYAVNSVICLALMLGFGHLQPIGSITPLGMDILGIFIGLIYGWSTVGTIWPSLVGILAMGFTDYATVSVAIKEAMGNDVVWQLFFIMAMLAPIESEGVANHISKFFLSLGFVKGRPWVFTLVFLFATYILSASTSGTATILLMWAILYSILSSVGYTNKDRYTSLMIFGVVYASVLGFATFPFKGPALAILRSYTAASGNVVDNALYMLVIIPISIIMLLGFIAMMRFVFRPNLDKLKNIDLDAYFASQKLGKMTFRQRILLGILILSILLMFVPSILPKTWAAAVFLNTLGTSGAMTLIIALMVGIRVEGRPLLAFKQAAPKIQWGIVFLVMAALYVAGALCTEGTGVTQFFYDLLYPILGGRSESTFTLLGLLSGVILTNFGNNAAMGVVLMPIIHAFTLESAFDPYTIVTLVTMIVFVALLTPIASPHAALLHGNKEWISTKNVYLYGIAMTIWSILVAFVIGLPLARMIF